MHDRTAWQKDFDAEWEDRVAGDDATFASRDDDLGDEIGAFVRGIIDCAVTPAIAVAAGLPHMIDYELRGRRRWWRASRRWAR
jgi:hypothetical protein